MHEDIKRFPLEGAITDALNVVEHKERLISFIEGAMRDEGYVPLLDMEPHFNQRFDVEGEHFEFKLSVYGVFVGKEESWGIAGVMSGNKIPKYIAPSK